MPTIFDTIKLVKKKLNKTIENDADFLRSTVVYNTKENLIILLSFGSKHFYNVLDFVNTINIMDRSAPITCLLSHTAIEKELTPEENSDFDKKPVTMIDNKYYLLISAQALAYAALYDYIDQSNLILEEITKDIYYYCDSALFKNPIDAGILQLGKFRYKNIVPEYDKHFIFDNSLNIKSGKYDDAEKIISKIPNTYSKLDLCRIFNIYYDKNKAISARNLVKIANEFDPDDQTQNPYFYALFKILTRENYLFSKIVKNPCIEVLSSMLKPIYLREESDEEEELNADLPIDKLDEIFQQEYDRFINPTADAGVEYEDIDEQIASDAESENMRPEDIISDDE